MCLITKGTKPDLRAGRSEEKHGRYATMEQVRENITRGHESL